MSNDFGQYSTILKLITHMKESGSWCGETHIQKCVYILQYGYKSGATDFEFIIYKHGPYSFDLHDEIQTLISMGLIDLVPNLGYGPSLETSPKGYELVSRFPKTVAQFDPTLSEVSRTFSNKTVTELERISTALYVEQEMPNADIATKLARFIELKPYLPPQSAEAGFRELHSGLKR